MKKALVLAVLILNMVSYGKNLETRMIDGQRIIFEIGKKKPYTGSYSITSTNYDGSVYTKESGKYKNGFYNGLIKTFYNNGKLESERNYKSGVLDGTTKEYYSNGNTKKIIEYKDGNYVSYYEYIPAGALLIKKTYKNGSLHGEFQDYNDKRLVKAYYNNGLLEGEYIQYQQGSDRLGIVSNYKDGFLDGEYTSYYSDGVTVAEKIQYKNGKKDGISLYYSSKTIEKANFREGKLEGEYLLSTKEGKILKKLNFLDGKRHGEHLEYYPNGALKSKLNYQADKLDGERIEYGVKDYINTSRGLEINSTEVQLKANYKMGILDGPYIEYDENWKLIANLIFRDDEILDGEIYRYDYYGSLRSKEIYKNGKRVKNI